MEKQKVALAAPWTKYYRQIKALFGKDPEIKIIYDEDDVDIKMYVDNPRKAEALGMILPVAQQFGNISVKITIIPSNKVSAIPNTETITFAEAFENNPIIDHISYVEGVFNTSMTYVSFVNEVVQFFNDNLGDEYGLCSTIYEDIAREVFDSSKLKGIYFCTVPKMVDNSNSLGAPLGEWP